jgi:hypothetical protein
MIEAHIKKALKAYLTEIGAYQFWPVQMGYGATTIDVLVCHKGKFYGIETKRPGIAKPTAAQACVMRDIAEAGGGVCLENDPELKAVRALLAQP